MKSKRAFTLIELVVVLAVAAVLLLIIAIPMVQGFNLTRASQAYSEAQSVARTVKNLIIEDLSTAAGVRFNPTAAGGVNLQLPSGVINFPGTKIDILLPAQGDPQRGPSGAFINPDTGREDPTYDAPRGQVELPAVPGMSMVRYWIGLRTPLADVDGDGDLDNNPYNDPYSGVLMDQNQQTDNLFVLYRAEVQPMVFDEGLGQYVVSTMFFADADTDNQPDFDDPDFFRIAATDVDLTGALNAQGLQKVARINNWKERGNIVTQLSRYDMIQAKTVMRFDAATGTTRRMQFADARAGFVPLIRFQPRQISDESVKGQRGVKIGDETDNPLKIGPETYRTEFSQWSGNIVKIYPGTYVAPAGSGAASSGGGARPASAAAFPYLEIRSRTRGGNGVLYGQISSVDVPVALFDSELYNLLKKRGTPYPFTAAIDSADAINVANGLAGARIDVDHVDLMIAAVVDPINGIIAANFDIKDVGDDDTGPFAEPDNRFPSDGADPGVDIGPAETPNSDVDVSVLGSPWVFTDTYRTINNRFNNIWQRWNDFAATLDRARFAKRYIYLGQIMQPGGVPSPLNRLNGTTRAVVTPGSDYVYGPDQRPGPGYGTLVRYSRIASRPVGANQYYINYTDMPEPDWETVFPTAPSYDPKAFDPDDFVSAVLQPQYRAGYVEFNSKFGEPLPVGNIFVGYRFQFTEPNDRFVVDYDTGDTVEVVLTIKNFPQSNVEFAQVVTVKGSARVRNFLR